MKKLLRSLLRARWFQLAVGFLVAEYLRLVWRTNEFSFDPADVYERVEPHQPLIFAFWHGQHFLTSFIKSKDDHRAKVLISRHRDGEINAIVAERLGVGTVRGSGDHGSAFHRKGGVGAFKEMVRSLAEGYNMAMTADVPKGSRVAGLGIIMLARESGRPILPFAMVTSRFMRLEQLGPLRHQFAVRPRCSGGHRRDCRAARRRCRTMEALRLQLEEYLNELTRRAYAEVGRPEAG